MPVITERRSFNGFDVKVERLGLTGLIDEVEEAVTSFELLVHEREVRQRDEMDPPENRRRV